MGKVYTVKERWIKFMINYWKHYIKYINEESALPVILIIILSIICSFGIKNTTHHQLTELIKTYKYHNEICLATPTIPIIIVNATEVTWTTVPDVNDTINLFNKIFYGEQ